MVGNWWKLFALFHLNCLSLWGFLRLPSSPHMVIIILVATFLRNQIRWNWIHIKVAAKFSVLRHRFAGNAGSEGIWLWSLSGFEIQQSNKFQGKSTWSCWFPYRLQCLFVFSVGWQNWVTPPPSLGSNIDSPCLFSHLKGLPHRLSIIPLLCGFWSQCALMGKYSSTPKTVTHQIILS